MYLVRGYSEVLIHTLTCLNLRRRCKSVPKAGTTVTSSSYQNLPVGELVDPFGAVIAEIANLESRNEKRGLELLILRRSGIGDSCRRGTASNRS